MEDLTQEINRLRKEKNAVILSHNYQRPEVQEIADYVADSLGLAQKAAKSTADVIVLCGVRFMAETASILSPDRIVLIPDPDAGCPMANMITAEDVRGLRRKHPEAACVAYINSTADVKAEIDVCCTSSNAVEVVNSLDEDEVIFVPDKYLGQYVESKTDKKLILWNGYCPTHVKIQPEDILTAKKEHPRAMVIVHPECTPQVIKLADAALSTGNMLKYAKENNAREYIIGTEVGIIYQLEKKNPGKRFFPASRLATCPNMKKTTLPKVLSSLENMEHVVVVPEDIRKKALGSIERMLEIR